MYKHEFGRQAIRLAITWYHWIVCHSACRSSEDQDNLDCRWIRPRSVGFTSHHGHSPTAWCFLVIVLLIDCQCEILGVIKTVFIALIESPSSCSGVQAGRKFVTYRRFFSFVRRIWHTPRGGIHDVVRDVSAKRLARQMVYSRFSTNLHKILLLTYLPSMLKSLLCRFPCLHVSDRDRRAAKLIPISRRSCLLFQLSTWNCNCLIVMHKNFNYKDATSSNTPLRKAGVPGNPAKFMS